MGFANTHRNGKEEEMETSTIDQEGHIVLPKKILDAAGIDTETEVIIELTQDGVLLKSRQNLYPITKRIARMSLPVADWEQMEHEIEMGRSNSGSP